MNRSTIQETFPGGPSPDYESTETQHKATSGTAIVSNSQKPQGMTEKPSQQGVDVVPGHSVVSRQPDIASAQSTRNTSSDPSPQPALYSDIQPIHNSSSGATAAADPKPASEDSPSRGPQDTAQLSPENTSPENATSSPEAPAGGNPQRFASLASRRTNRSLATNGSAFANGAATAMNDPPDVDPGLQARAASAEGELRPRDKAEIRKEESNVGRRLSKIIRSEAKTEKASLDVALVELAELQKRQKVSVKEEAESHTRHSRALSDAHKAEMKVLMARTAHEREQAGLQAAGKELEECRKHARETTDMLRDKMQEVERLRLYKGVDDRERAVKVKSLNGQRIKGLSRILRSE